MRASTNPLAQGTSLPPAGWTNLCQWSSSASDCCWKAWAASLSASESEAALEAIACLLRPVLHQRDPAPSRREKQFQKIIALIDASIQSEHLRPEWLASETGMSVRSLYRLFADQGLVVAQYIKNRRLDLCAQALQNVHDDEKLAGIGYRWGFSDHSHFSTAFKQRFGVTPGEYRKRCR